jgi:MYXO-CTERM domain-containing protein
VTLDLTRKAVQRRTHPLVWDMGLARVLQLPTWGVLGLLGLALGYLGRRRREVNIYAN